MLAILLCPLLLALPGLDVLAEDLLVEGTASALVPPDLRHQRADHLEILRVLLPVVIACQVEPTEYATTVKRVGIRNLLPLFFSPVLLF